MAAHEYPQGGEDDCPMTTRHGSGEPVITEHYKTLYYLIIYSVYDATLQVYRIYILLLSFSLPSFLF
jgi:hypothetical protein